MLKMSSLNTAEDKHLKHFIEVFLTMTSHNHRVFSNKVSQKVNVLTFISTAIWDFFSKGMGLSFRSGGMKKMSHMKC